MRLLRIGILLLLHQYPLFGQENKTLNPDSLLMDFKILKTTIQQNHPIIYNYISQDSFRLLSIQIEKQIAVGQTLSQFNSSVSQFLSSVGCGHTYTYPTKFAMKKLNDNMDLPFSIAIINDSIFITKTYGKVEEKYIGAAIIGINNIFASTFLKSAYEITSADGYNTTYKKIILQNKFKYYINEILNYPDTLVINTSKGELVISFPTNFRRDVKEETYPAFKKLTESPNTVLLSIPNFDEGKSTIKKCFRFLHINKIDNLIIDLRDNGGGNGNIGSLLLSYIVDTAIIYYLDKKTTPFNYGQYLKGGQGLIISNQYEIKDSIIKSYYFKIKPKKKNNFNGNLYVLINGGTFSSAAYVSSVLKHKTNSLFIGEETGGSQYAIGGGVIKKLRLPYSQLGINFPLYKWSFYSSHNQNGHGVTPNIIINYQINDVINQTDLGYKKTIEIIK